MYPFERFTQASKRVLTLAQEEAEGWHHPYIGTEHMLVGMLRDDGCLAAKVLRIVGVREIDVRTTIQSVLSREERILSQQVIPTSRVKKVIEISFEEARRMGNNYVGTEHLLLGLLIEGEGVAAHVLDDLGATLDKVRGEIETLHAAGATEETGLTSEASSFRARTSWSPVFTTGALAVIARAGVVADRNNRTTVGTVDLLLALLGDPACRAVHVLRNLGVDVAALQTQLETTDVSTSRDAPATMSADEDLSGVVERSFNEARRLEDGSVRTEHLLLALLSAGTDAAARVLMDAGLTAERVRTAIRRG